MESEGAPEKASVGTHDVVTVSPVGTSLVSRLVSGCDSRQCSNGNGATMRLDATLVDPTDTSRIRELLGASWSSLQRR